MSDNTIRMESSLVPSSSYTSPQKSGNCYKCGQPGHWVYQCPLVKSPQKPRLTGQQQSDDPRKYRIIRCRCDQGDCIIYTTKDGRCFYKCPQDSFMNCGYNFQCNKAGLPEFNNHHLIPFPECPCGAGLCTFTEQDNLKCFTCRVPMGQGACNFFQWYEIPPHAKFDAVGNMSNRTNFLPSNLNNQGNAELEQGGASSRKRSRANESDPVTEDGYIHLSSSGGTSGPSRTIQLEDRSCDTASGDMSPLSDPLRETQSVTHLRQIRFMACISSAETPPNGPFPNFDASIASLPPHPDALVTESSEVLPDSPPSASKSKRSEMSPQSPFGGARLFNKVLCDSPTPQRPQNAESDSIITDSILEAYKSAALQVQKKLLTRLESLHPSDHKIMDKEARTVFASLDQLSVDYSSFYERVMEYIHTAFTLAEMECSIPGDILSQELTERCDSKRLHLEELSCDQAAVINSLSVNEARCQMLREEVTSCEEEAASLKIRLAELSEMKLKSEQDLQAAYDEAEKFEKLHEQGEVKRRSAVHAFEKARTQLWA